MPAATHATVCWDAPLDKFLEKAQNRNRVPRTTSSFESSVTSASDEAEKVGGQGEGWAGPAMVLNPHPMLVRCDVMRFGVQVFEQAAEMAKGEKVYGPYRAAYEVRWEGEVGG